MSSLRERLLQLLDELPDDPRPAEPALVSAPQARTIIIDSLDNETEAAEVDPIPVSEPEPIATSAPLPGACPRCHTTQPLQPAGFGAGKRCQACGFQEPVSVAHGFSRKDVDNGNLPETKMRMNPRSFYVALARTSFR